MLIHSVINDRSNYSVIEFWAKVVGIQYLRINDIEREYEKYMI